MKATKNTLYRIEDYINGKLIEPDGNLNKTEFTSLTLTEEESKEIVSILEKNIPNYGHKCISIYRDGIVVDGVVYNICLSCGDFYKGNEHFYLSKEGIDKFNNFKNEIINRD